MRSRLVTTLSGYGPALSLAGTIAALLLAAWLLDWAALLDACKRLSIASILMAAVFCTLTHAVIAVRWALIAAPPAQPPSGREMLTCLHASLFNLITPGSLGADAHRIAAGADRTGGRTGSATMVLTERVLGVAAQAIVYVAGYAILSADSPVGRQAGLPAAFTVAAGALAVVAAVGIAALIWGLPTIHARLARRNSDTHPDAPITEDHRPTIARNAVLLGLSIAAVAAWVAAAVSLAHSAGLAMPVLPLTLVVILTEFARMLPISLQGIGVREITFSVLAAQLGEDGAAAFVVGAVLYFLNYTIVAAVGLTAGLILHARTIGRAS